MGWPVAFQHSPVGTLRRTGDAAFSGRDIRSDELFSGFADARARTPTRSRSAAATSITTRPETRPAVDYPRSGRWTCGCLRADASVVRIAVWSSGSGCNDVYDNLLTAGVCLVAGLLPAGTTRDAHRPAERVAIRVEDFSRKGAAAQRAAAFLEVFFAPLRL